MHCPSCQAENSEQASQCTSCQAPLNGKREPEPRSSRKRRSGRGQTPSAVFNRDDPRQTFALKTVYGSLVGFIPLVGLLSGPIFLLLGLAAWYRCRKAGLALGARLGMITVGLALVTGVCTWAAVWLMYMGLSSSGWL